MNALNKGGLCFHYIWSKFPSLNNEKVKGGLFDGSQVKKVMKDRNSLERVAWNSFVIFINDFLGQQESNQLCQTSWQYAGELLKVGSKYEHMAALSPWKSW